MCFRISKPMIKDLTLSLFFYCFLKSSPEVIFIDFIVREGNGGGERNIYQLVAFYRHPDQKLNL